MDKKFREAIRNAYIALLGKTIESLLNEYEVDFVERDADVLNGALVGGFILVPVFEDGGVELGEILHYEPIKGCTFCVLTLDYEGNPSVFK